MKKLLLILPLALILSFMVGCQDKEAMAELEEFCFVSAKFGQMRAFLKLQIMCNNLKLGGMHEYQEKVQDFA